jgi:hypothetical protein
MTTPNKRPDQLSPAAQALYTRTCATYGKTLQNKDFPVDPDSIAAALEIAQAGLGSYRMSSFSGADHHYLWATKLHPQYFTARSTRADARLYIEIYTIGHDSREDALLGCLFGADLERRSNNNTPLTPWSLRVVHGQATDFEHDSVYLARIDLANLAPTWFSGSTTEFYGALGTEILFWSEGVDPFATAIGDYEPGPDCTSCTPPHPFGPYTPPGSPAKSALANTPVILKVTPFDLVDENGDLLRKDESTD